VDTVRRRQHHTPGEFVRHQSAYTHGGGAWANKKHVRAQGRAQELNTDNISITMIEQHSIVNG